MTCMFTIHVRMCIHVHVHACMPMTWYISSSRWQDDEGREVAIKIDRIDKSDPKKFNLESATKSYVEVS